MPALFGSDKPVAILCSDLHLSHTPPASRGETREAWYGAMKRVLVQLKEWQNHFGVPIICAGDIFDRWNPPIELVNFALEYLPPMFAVAGQHDLPHHNIEDVHRSAFWTLRISDVIEWLGNAPHFAGSVRMYGANWGEKAPRPSKGVDRMNILAIHRYIWRGKHHPGVGVECNVTAFQEEFEDYDVVVIGDNHVPFQGVTGSAYVWNNGSMMLRRSDDSHEPRCGLLTLNRGVVDLKFDTSMDQLLERTEIKETPVDRRLNEFLSLLGDATTVVGDMFEDLLRASLKKMSPKARQIVNQIIEESSISENHS